MHQHTIFKVLVACKFENSRNSGKAPWNELTTNKAFLHECDNVFTFGRNNLHKCKLPVTWQFLIFKNSRQNLQASHLQMLEFLENLDLLEQLIESISILFSRTYLSENSRNSWNSRKTLGNEITTNKALFNHCDNVFT